MLQQFFHTLIKAKSSCTIRPLDLIFPKFCVLCLKEGDFICSSCFRKIKKQELACPYCKRVNFSGSFCPAHQRHSKLNGLLFYTIYNSQAEKLIYGFKYEGLKQIAKFLGYLMAQILKEHPIFKKEIILCPVPMWFLKRLKRGFNQSELLAQDIGSRLNLDYANLLLKNRSTKSQTQLAEEQRIKNVQNSFVLSKLAHKINLKQKTIILVDDVYTTGSTLFEAAAVFKNHPLNRPKAIWGLVFARD